MLKQYRLKNYHFQLVIYIIALSIIGILLIGSAKHSVQSKQIIGFVMGLTIMIVLSLIDYSFLLKFVWIYYAGMVISRNKFFACLQILHHIQHGGLRRMLYLCNPFTQYKFFICILTKKYGT